MPIAGSSLTTCKNDRSQHRYRESGSQALVSASSRGHTNVVRVLIQDFITLGIPIAQFHEALVMAPVEGHKDVVEILIESCVNTTS